MSDEISNNVEKTPFHYSKFIVVSFVFFAPCLVIATGFMISVFQRSVLIGYIVSDFVVWWDPYIVYWVWGLSLSGFLIFYDIIKRWVFNSEFRFVF